MPRCSCWARTPRSEPCLVLGAVQRQVRVSQDVLRSLLGRIVESDPDASSDEHLLSFECKGRLQYLRDPLRYLYPFTNTSNVLYQDGELVSAKTRRGVIGA